MVEPSDETLMALVAAGDWAAFDRLVLRHQDAVWRTAYRIVADCQAAEDLAQDAFLRIFEAADRYRPEAAFRTYLYRVLVRLCLDYRRKGRAMPAEAALLATDEASRPDQRLVEGEREAIVQQAVARLPARQRAAIVLKYNEGLAVREIAEAMQLSVKAVERLLARGRATLERRLGRLLDASEETTG